MSPPSVLGRRLSAAILLVACLGTMSCAVVAQVAIDAFDNVHDGSIFRQGRHGVLSDDELAWAKVAWSYFENNYDSATGLVNATESFPQSTMWGVGDHLAALHAARTIGLIDQIEFDNRLSTAIAFLNEMELADGQLPNKAYHVATGAMSDGANESGAIGWSAIDLGRLLIWLRIISDHYSSNSEYVDKAVLRWNFCHVIDTDGNLRGAVLQDNEIRYYQEGRLGYEEYAALGFRAWGFSTPLASKIDPMRILAIEGVRLPADSRDDRLTGIQAPLVSLPFFLLGLEFNWDKDVGSGFFDSIHTHAEFGRVADAVYRVQEARYENQRVFTARTDHPVSATPYYVHDSIFAGGYAWNTISDDGDYHQDLALVSTRAAFPMWALWDTPYTSKLIDLVHPLHDKKAGWFEGRYESTGRYERALSSTTNAAVLEAILYKLQGKSFENNGPNRHWTYLIGQEFEEMGRCWPSPESGGQAT